MPPRALNEVIAVIDPLLVNAAPVMFPLDPTYVNNAVLGVTLPIGVDCIPPRALNVVAAVIDPLLVKAAPVMFPLDPTLVNNAVLGVTLPIGVACIPPRAPNVVTAVIDPLLVNAAPVTLPVALSVVTIAVLPPADPSVPFNGPLNELVAVYVAPVNTALALPIVAAFIVVPVNVPTTPNVPPTVAELLTVNAFTVVFACTFNVLVIVARPVSVRFPVLTVP